MNLTTENDTGSEVAGSEFVSKLPLITAGYWVIKICATTLGETRADHLSMTRPFGSTFGDLLTKSQDKGGLGLGTMETSLVLATLLTAFVVKSWIDLNGKPLKAAVGIIEDPDA